MRGSPDVIVIGAGIAGLAAATSLASAGARVLVVEARGAPGGRTASFVDPQTGHLVDTGQHIVLGCYRETFEFLDRVEARDGIALQTGLEVPMVDLEGRRSTLRCPPWPSPFHLVAGVLNWKALGWGDWLALVRLLPALREARRRAAARSPAPTHLGTQTVAQWLHDHGQSARLCELLWEPLAVAALNQPIATAAAECFVRVLGGVFGPDPRDAAIGLPVKPLVKVFGDPARDYLEARGSAVRLHAPARLLLSGARVAGVRIRGDDVVAGAVVAATAWQAWRNLVGEHEADAAGIGRIRADALRRKSSPIVTVNLWFERAVLETRFLGLPGRVFQWVFERRHDGRAGTTSAVHLSLVSSGAESIVTATDRTLVELAWSELRAALPGPRNEPTCASVVRERQATFSLEPGEPARPGPRTGLDGLWLAGDWTDTGLPATIEGAAQSGHAVAAAILGRSA